MIAFDNFARLTEIDARLEGIDKELVDLNRATFSMVTFFLECVNIIKDTAFTVLFKSLVAKIWIHS